MNFEIDPSLKEEYPFASKFLSIDNLQYHYVDEGTGPETILMLHGNPTWSFYYRNLIKRFSNTFRVVAPDHIGCGLSDKPQNYPYRLTNHINNLELLISSLNLKNIHLVIHDWGGAIGMGYAVKHPQLIRTITVLNTAAFLMPNIPWSINFCRTPIIGELLIRGLNGFAKPAIYMASLKKGQMTDNIKKGYLFPYNNWKNRIATHRFVKDIPLNSKHPTWEVMKLIENNLTKISHVPISIFWGGKDFCFNQIFLKRWQQIFPHAQVVVYEDAGHYVLEDAKPQIIDDIERWIKQ